MCRTITLPDGSTLIACSRGDHARPRGQKCTRCGGAVSFLCDFLVKPEETKLDKRCCSAPMCRTCAHAGPGHDVHLCFLHRKATAAEVYQEVVPT